MKNRIYIKDEKSISNYEIESINFKKGIIYFKVNIKEGEDTWEIFTNNKLIHKIELEDIYLKMLSSRQKQVFAK